MRTPSGLIVPNDKTPQERFDEAVQAKVDEVLKRRTPRPVFEIQDEDNRRKASRALYDLYNAMNLGRNCGGIVLPDDMKERKDLHRTLWRSIGHVLLGNDCPAEWEKT